MPEMLRIVCGIVFRGREILIARRPDDSHLGGLWEFPGGKVETGETLEEALRRELREETGLAIEEPGLFFEKTFTYPERSVHLHFYTCRAPGGQQARAKAAEECRWIAAADLDNYAFPEANQELIQLLKQDF